MITRRELAATAAALRNPEELVRALTFQQPWAASVAWHFKDVENRSWPAPHTDVLTLVHAAKTVDRAAMRQVPSDTPGLDVRGAVVAVTRVTGCHRNTRCQGQCTPWAMPEARWHWELSGTLPLAEPVPVAGAQRMWIPGTELRTRVATALNQRAGEAR
ncbi:hypothetical protein [Streptomyces aidingensis]|uniref:ASCH domain-containing protein n=1 Tax=Streptomyces aidingensis TaxID=910347 RepID=A0A1I1UUL1_9ACTN|nr:hypothetical protein [Streptomyces aidingensis]SFD74265.1 hypothetical protein SAMN05421773_12713 [Streptomyces aidingensis]